MKRYSGFLIISILVFTSCSPSHIIHQTDNTPVQIKKFNYDSFERGGRIRLRDGSAHIGHQFHLTDSNLTWTDSSTQNKLSVPVTDVVSVDIIKKASSQDAAGGAVKGILLGGIIGAVAGRITTPHKPETEDREDNALEVLASMITLGAVGSVVGGFIGAGSGHHDTRITKVFSEHAPVGNAVRPAEVQTRARDSSMNGHKEASTALSKKTETIGRSVSPISQNSSELNKTALGGLSWSLTNTFIPLYVGAQSLGNKSYRVVPMGYGLVIGPSIGHFYASDKRRGWIGIGIRSAGFALYTIGKGRSGGMKAAGIALISAGIGYSLYTVPSSVREYNARRSWSFAPLVDPAGKSASLNLQINF